MIVRTTGVIVLQLEYMYMHIASWQVEVTSLLALMEHYRASRGARIIPN